MPPKVPLALDWVPGQLPVVKLNSPPPTGIAATSAANPSSFVPAGTITPLAVICAAILFFAVDKRESSVKILILRPSNSRESRLDGAVQLYLARAAMVSLGDSILGDGRAVKLPIYRAVIDHRARNL